MQRVCREWHLKALQKKQHGQYLLVRGWLFMSLLSSCPALGRRIYMRMAYAACVPRVGKATSEAWQKKTSPVVSAVWGLAYDVSFDVSRSTRCPIFAYSTAKALPLSLLLMFPGLPEVQYLHTVQQKRCLYLNKIVFPTFPKAHG